VVFMPEQYETAFDRVRERVALRLIPQSPASSR